MRSAPAFLVAVVVAVAGWSPRAAALSSYYTAECSACHGAATPTCNGCHAHGTHSSSAKSDINLAGALSGATYAPGDTVTVTVNGGYRSGWMRAVLLDQNMQELARSSCGTGSGVPQGCSTSVFPLTLSHAAPATAGTYTWAVAWYGNKRDATGASFGNGTSSTLAVGSFKDDPNNPNHGWQVVALSAFTVTAPAPVPTPTPTPTPPPTTTPEPPSTPTTTAPPATDVPTTTRASTGCSTGQGSASVAMLLLMAGFAVRRAWRRRE